MPAMSFHYNKSTGKSARCRAQPGRCPLGAPGEHFSTQEQAQAAAEKYLETRYSTLQDYYDGKKSLRGSIEEMPEALKMSIIDLAGKKDTPISPAIVSRVLSDDSNENIRVELLKKIKQTQPNLRRMSKDESKDVRHYVDLAMKARTAA